MEIWVATTNQGKLDEFRTLLSGPGLTIKSIKDAPSYFIPKETGQSFLENAQIKARSFKSFKSDNWVVAEDSGLETEGLNNMPGIFSARYAGDKASDAENMAKLLKMLKIRSQNRKARFRCALVAISPDGTEHSFEGNLDGLIAAAPAGQMGFGYDPIFIPDGQNQTLAQLGPAVKNKISHRAQAIRQFSKLLVPSSSIA